VLLTAASAPASVVLVGTDSAATAANSGPGQFTLTDEGAGNRDGIYSYNYDAGASFDMLVVSVSREASTPEIFSVSYGGVDMNPATGSTTGTGASIFYLATASSSGTIAVDFSSFATVNGIGIGIAAIRSDNGDPIALIDANSGSGTSISLDPTLDGSFTMFAIDTNTGAFSGLDASPLSQIFANTDVGSNGAGAAYDADVAAGSIIYSYTNTASPRGIAAANFATVPEPSSVAAIGGMFVLSLFRRRRGS
jgi:hypothetical protein